MSSISHNVTAVIAPAPLPSCSSSSSSSSSSGSSSATYAPLIDGTSSVVWAIPAMSSIIFSFLSYHHHPNLVHVCKSFHVILEPGRLLALQSRMIRQESTMHELHNTIGRTARDLTGAGVQRRLTIVQDGHKIEDNPTRVRRNLTEERAVKNEAKNGLYRQLQDAQQRYSKLQALMTAAQTSPDLRLHRAVTVLRVQQDRRLQREATILRAKQDPQSFAPFTLASTIFSS